MVSRYSRRTFLLDRYSRDMGDGFSELLSRSETRCAMKRCRSISLEHPRARAPCASFTSSSCRCLGAALGYFRFSHAPSSGV